MLKPPQKLRFTNPDEAIRAMPNLPRRTAAILWGRGIKGSSEAEKFLHPDYDNHLHDPMKLKGMGKAVDRILKAIKNNEKIAIFSDYDADGIPGAVMWHDFFKRIGYKNFRIYIPHRHDEGFGLSNEAVEILLGEGANLIITLDCGIVDVEEVARANELGADVIITDHHLPNGKLPNAFAIVNPKQENCEYPYKDLCGSGVAFKLLTTLIKKGNGDKIFTLKDGTEKWFLDMAGIATLSDMVPLVGENRVLAHFGLRVLRKSQRVGLQNLLRAQKLEQSKLNEEDVGFSITPRINVASRMASPTLAFNLLSTSDNVEAFRLVSELEGLNQERKSLVAGIVKDIKKRIREDQTLADQSILVFGHTHWKPAVLGLASNTIMREVGKPVFVWGRDGGTSIKGSCRSNGSVNLVDLMSGVKEGIFVEFGGHAFSGGFSVTDNAIHDLSFELNKSCEKLTMEKVDDEVLVDARIKVEDVGPALWQEIVPCAPFGMGNPRPIFILENVTVSAMKLFGKSREHVELTLEGESGETIKAIQFFAAGETKFKELDKNIKIDLLANMEESLFRGYPEYRLRIVDIV